MPSSQRPSGPPPDLPGGSRPVEDAPQGGRDRAAQDRAAQGQPRRPHALGRPHLDLGDGAEVDPLRQRAQTLIDWLDDESPRVVATVREQLLELGQPAARALRAAARDERPRVRARSRALATELDWRHDWRRLCRLAGRGNTLDLEAGLWRMARLTDPAFDARGYRKALDAMASRVAERAAAAPDDVSAPMALADVLGNELGYIGAEVDYDHPDNIHLHRAIERKRGMPLTLTALYLLVARRAGLRAAAVPMPGHVLLRLRAGRRALLIDPFHGGRMRTRQDCVQHLARHGLVPRPEWFRDATDAQLFQRHVRNLMNSMQTRGLQSRASALAVLAGALARSD